MPSSVAMLRILLALLKDPAACTTDEMIARVRMGRRAVRVGLAALVADGRLQRSGAGVKGDSFMWSLSPDRPKRARVVAIDSAPILVRAAQVLKRHPLAPSLLTALTAVLEQDLA